MRNLGGLGLSLLLFLSSVPLSAAPESRDSVASDSAEFETILRLRVAAMVLTTVERAGRTVPEFEDHFRSVDSRLLQALDPSAREILPQKDAWGARLQVLHFENTWIVVSAGSDGKFHLPGVFEKMIAKKATADELDFEDDLAVAGDELITPRPEEHGPEQRTMNDIRSIATAIEAYTIDNDAYPCPHDGIVPLEGLRSMLEPIYIKTMPREDGWGNPILFSCSPQGYGLVSFGPDGNPDTNYAGAGPGLSGLGRKGQTTEPGADIVFIDGQFTDWPAKAQR